MYKEDEKTLSFFIVFAVTLVFSGFCYHLYEYLCEEKARWVIVVPSIIALSVFVSLKDFLAVKKAPSQEAAVSSAQDSFFLTLAGMIGIVMCEIILAAKGDFVAKVIENLVFVSIILWIVPIALIVFIFNFNLGKIKKERKRS